jgi:dTDP-4-dehydrorhamnose 3,5-epimerase
MEILPTPFRGALILKPKRFDDSRGFFSESYSKRRLKEIGICIDFVQDNLSYSKSTSTLRGLHFQKAPYAQAKLVSVVRGVVLDVIVDLRRNSAGFGKYHAIELSAAEGNQLFIPAGFAHGFITREPDTVFAYKASAYYSPDHDTGIRFDDPTLGINWGVDCNQIFASEKDRHLPSFDPQGEYCA